MEFTALAIHLRVVAWLELALTDAARLRGQAAAHAAMLLRRQLVPQAALAAVTAQVQPSVHFLHRAVQKKFTMKISKDPEIFFFFLDFLEQFFFLEY